MTELIVENATIPNILRTNVTPEIKLYSLNNIKLSINDKESLFSDGEQ